MKNFFDTAFYSATSRSRFLLALLYYTGQMTRWDNDLIIQFHLKLAKLLILINIQAAECRIGPERQKRAKMLTEDTTRAFDPTSPSHKQEVLGSLL